ncbi:MAG: QueT transporter family protein [Symbiobacteriaceae bacterium]|nr:QueT transporter family protein [Symbiobacteriaceae bacterium]
MRHFSVNQVAKAGIIAALYAVLALALPEFSYNIMQFRLSEGLVLLPLYLPEAIPGLALGCLLANLGSPFGILDIIGGTLCTALAAWLTWRWRQNIVLATLAPIVVNALGVSAYLAFLSKELYFTIVPAIALSETVICLVIALPLSRLVARLLKV